ncbi:nitrilase-related carbon-nitrogen hydrolase [uncultured Caballeronia sp.]|jgi:predicted amidohydrolase|uniref:nitrilase-related carbon-nitrogen hydrolase n=1 Tax=uncultured Caballeronia sp. TaxID=1827198 RepID=UPI001575310B
MNDGLTVAAAQVETIPGDIAGNVERHLLLMAEARAANVNVLVFPELSLVGHGAGADALRLAMPADHAVLCRLAEASGPMHTVVGFIEEAPGAQFYNSVATLAHGRVVHVHRKIGLATYGKLDDGKFYAPGSTLSSFPLGDPRWQVTTPICADWWNPSLVHGAACAGMTLGIAPISSALEAVGDQFDNPRGWDTVLRFYALVYGLPIVMANRVGREGDLHFWGGSRILDPNGKILAESREPREELVIASLDYGDVRRARFALPTVRDANARNRS